MPYRDGWVLKILGTRSVLEAALDVHSTARGSMERSREEQDADAKALTRVVATWKNHGICKFDDLVLELIKEALSEWSRKNSKMSMNRRLHTLDPIFSSDNYVLEELAARFGVGVDVVILLCDEDDESELKSP